MRTEKGVGFLDNLLILKIFDTQKLLIRIKTGVGNYPDFNLEDNKNVGSLTLITPEPGVFLNLEKFTNPKINNKAWRIPDNGIAANNNIH